MSASPSRKVLVLLGHPDRVGLCGRIADAYAAAARAAGHQVDEIRLGELAFDPVLHRGFRAGQPLEPDLVEAQRRLAWCEHLVVVVPVWWGSTPALFKGFCDRVLLPGFAFRYHERGLGWDRLLAGRSARLVMTMDAPGWVFRLMFRSAAERAVADATLGFCGFKPVRRSIVGSARRLATADESRLLARIGRLGAEAV
jgi:putative NADPH-quinone reductase